MKVLIADDSAVIREQLHDVLVGAGYEVVIAEDGQQAWDTLRTGTVHLAILDWLMPHLSGVEICRKLQVSLELKAAYTIILTSKSGEDSVAEALSAGANDFLVKPFRKRELVARLGAAKRIVRLQLDLREATRLASLGQLAAGIAHEINTPLQYVGDNLQFLREGFSSLRDLIGQYETLCSSAAEAKTANDLIASIGAAHRDADIEYLTTEIPSAVDQSLEGIGRVSTIVQAMKSFCHPGTQEKTATDLNAAIETTITIARNEWKYVADVVTDFDPQLPHVYCLPGDFNQVVLNLLVNAAHAVADVVGDTAGSKGTITISTRHDGPWAEIRIRDTGTGIPEQVRDKVFDRFVTTKEAGKGTGQGLAIARNVVVEQHSGTIDFETKLGEGTTFVIRLPIELLEESQGTEENAEAHSVC